MIALPIATMWTRAAFREPVYVAAFCVRVKEPGSEFSGRGPTRYAAIIDLLMQVEDEPSLGFAVTAYTPPETLEDR